MASATLTPYIVFRGQARAALEFYGSIFGSQPEIVTHGSYGMTGPEAEWVMHGQLSTPAGFLMIADVPTGMEAVTGGEGGVSLCLWGDDEAALTGWFNALAENGTVTTALAKQMWGAAYGDLVDQFGIRWAANIDAAV